MIDVFVCRQTKRNTARNQYACWELWSQSLDFLYSFFCLLVPYCFVSVTKLKMWYQILITIFQKLNGYSCFFRYSNGFIYIQPFLMLFLTFFKLLVFLHMFFSLVQLNFFSLLSVWHFNIMITAMSTICHCSSPATNSYNWDTVCFVTLCLSFSLCNQTHIFPASYNELSCFPHQC